eukprot:15130727-Alexandrium_andersonii.AAC.1
MGWNPVGGSAVLHAVHGVVRFLHRVGDGVPQVDHLSHVGELRLGDFRDLVEDGLLLDLGLLLRRSGPATP